MECNVKKRKGRPENLFGSVQWNQRLKINFGAILISWLRMEVGGITLTRMLNPSSYAGFTRLNVESKLIQKMYYLINSKGLTRNVPEARVYQYHRIL